MFSYGSRSPEVALRGAALPHLESLLLQTRQVVHFAVLRKQEVLYLERLSTSSAISPATVGGRLPAHLTGVGKALLAYASAETVRRYLDRRLTARHQLTRAGTGNLGLHQPALGDSIGGRLHAGPSRSGRGRELTRRGPRRRRRGRRP